MEFQKSPKQIFNSIPIKRHIFLNIENIENSLNNNVSSKVSSSLFNSKNKENRQKIFQPIQQKNEFSLINEEKFKKSKEDNSFVTCNESFKTEQKEILENCGKIINTNTFSEPIEDKELLKDIEKLILNKDKEIKRIEKSFDKNQNKLLNLQEKYSEYTEKIVFFEKEIENIQKENANNVIKCELKTLENEKEKIKKEIAEQHQVFKSEIQTKIMSYFSKNGEDSVFNLLQDISFNFEDNVKRNFNDLNSKIKKIEESYLNLQNNREIFNDGLKKELENKVKDGEKYFISNFESLKKEMLSKNNEKEENTENFTEKIIELNKKISETKVLFENNSKELDLHKEEVDKKMNEINEKTNTFNQKIAFLDNKYQENIINLENCKKNDEFVENKLKELQFKIHIMQNEFSEARYYQENSLENQIGKLHENLNDYKNNLKIKNDQISELKSCKTNIFEKIKYIEESFGLAGQKLNLFVKESNEKLLSFQKEIYDLNQTIKTQQIKKIKNTKEIAIQTEIPNNTNELIFKKIDKEPELFYTKKFDKDKFLKRYNNNNVSGTSNTTNTEMTKETKQIPPIFIENPYKEKKNDLEMDYLLNQFEDYKEDESNCSSNSENDLFFYPVNSNGKAKKFQRDKEKNDNSISLISPLKTNVLDENTIENNNKVIAKSPLSNTAFFEENQFKINLALVSSKQNNFFENFKESNRSEEEFLTSSNTVEEMNYLLKIEEILRKKKEENKFQSGFPCKMDEAGYLMDSKGKYLLDYVGNMLKVNKYQFNYLQDINLLNIIN